MSSIVEFQSVDFGYSGSDPLYTDLSFSISRGSTVLIAGKNGAGKTTLFKLMIGIVRPQKGRILIQGHDIGRAPVYDTAKTVSVTFQNPTDQLFCSSIRHEVEYGPRALQRILPEELARTALEAFEVSHVANRHSYDVSPSIRRLVTAASAAATDAEVLAFDEPSAGMSVREERSLLKGFEYYKSIGKTILVVSHDFGLWFRQSDRILLFDSGKITFDGKPVELSENDVPLRKGGLRLHEPKRIELLVRRYVRNPWRA